MYIIGKFDTNPTMQLRPFYYTSNLQNLEEDFYTSGTSFTDTIIYWCKEQNLDSDCLRKTQPERFLSITW